MRITYANKKVEKSFENYEEMKKHMPADWVRQVKKHMARLKAADTFAVFLKLNLGHPEQLKGERAGQYSVRISGNVRLIIKPVTGIQSVMESQEIEVEGVVDYHGGKETWFIP